VVGGRSVRREYALVWTAIVVIGVVGVVHPVAAVVDVSREVRQYLLLAHALGLFVLPIAIAVGLLRVRLTRLRVADLVIELDRAVEPERVRAALAHALDDPALEVWFPLSGAGGYVRSDGRTGEPALDGRAATVVQRGDEVLAIVAHDAALRERRSLVDAAVAAARLALDNARLVAAQRVLVEQTRASRARIVVAADAERRRIQRDLHDGVQHKLLATGMLVERVRQQLGRPAAGADTALAAAAALLREAIGELRLLTEGIHPPALSEQGLAAAVEALAERAPLPVLVDISGRRWPVPVEQAAYFLVTEALANVYKHARATCALVRADERDGRLVVEVTDDGAGGARAAQGTGLRGLDDRVGAVGGTLRIDSPPGSGTCLVAELPCGS
jgi:signal transduction histidine kinase